MRDYCIKLYLVPCLLVQVYTAVQWDSLYQVHGQNPSA